MSQFPGCIAVPIVVAALFAVAGTPCSARAGVNPVPRPSTATIPSEPAQPGALASPLRASVAPGLFLDKSFHGWSNYPNAYDPPDCAGAAGEYGIIEVNNRSVSYRRKDGTLWWTTGQENALIDFFPLFHPPGNTVDPRVVYEPQLRRFFITAIQTRLDFESTPSHCYVHLAVSKSPHPLSRDTTDWLFFKFDVTQYEGSTPFGLDYPGLAADHRALYLAGNMFRYPLTAGEVFRNVMVVTIDKVLATQGVLAYTLAQTPTLHDLGSAFTLQPARLIGDPPSGNVEYFAEVPYDGPANHVRLWALQDPLGTPVLRDTSIVVPSWYGVYDGAAQCSGSDVRTWSPTAQSAFWRDGSLWTCHTSASSGGRTVLHYYRIETNGWPAGNAQLAESGTIDLGPGLWAYQPAMNGNVSGDVGMVFTASGASMCPTIMYTAYRANSGGFTPPAPLAGSPVPSKQFLWGDYGTVAEDPNDHGFWITHELQMSNLLGDWIEHWGNIGFDDNVPGWPDSGRVVRGGQIEARDATVIPAGAGASFILWREQGAVYAQRLNADGSSALPAPAVSVSTAADEFRAVSDLAGGFYLTWRSIYGGTHVNHISNTGVVSAGWPADGLDLGPSDDLPQIAASSAGVFLAWSGGGAARAQRVTLSGVPMWGSGGVVVDGTGWSPTIVPDGADGAIIACAPGRAQRVSGAGNLLWDAAGITLLPDGDTPVAVADGAGGMIAVFQTIGVDGGADLVAQRVTGAGALASGWAADGVPVCAHGGAQIEPSVLSDGAGGLFAAWRDQRTFVSTRSDIFAVRLGAGGVVAPGWTPDGVPVCTAPGYQITPALVTDGANGIRIFWDDRRAQPGCINGACNSDVYFQRLRSDGTFDPTLPANGFALSTAAGNQTQPRAAAVSGGTTVVAWNDGRLYPNCIPWCTTAVRARLIQGVTAVEPSHGTAARALELSTEPNPVALAGDGLLQMRFAVPDAMRGAPLRLEIFDLNGRRVRSLTVGSARPDIQQMKWDLRDSDGRAVRPGLYFARLRVGAAQVTRSVMVW